MKKIWLYCALAAMVFTATSCKPKQSAYKAAYEQAKEREIATQREATKADPTDITPITKPRTPDGTTVISERVMPAYGENADGLRKYSVVIGSFRNKTNATSLKERMIRDGYNALLAQNEEGMLRVIVQSFDSREAAISSRESIKNKYAPNFQDAWILEREY